MSPFEFATAARIVFGAGTFAQLDEIAAGHGKRPFVVTGKRSIGRAMFSVAEEPTIAVIREGAEAFRQAGFATSLVGIRRRQRRSTRARPLLPQPPGAGDLLDYLEVISKGTPALSIPRRRIHSSRFSNHRQAP